MENPRHRLFLPSSALMRTTMKPRPAFSLTNTNYRDAHRREEYPNIQFQAGADGIKRHWRNALERAASCSPLYPSLTNGPHSFTWSNFLTKEMGFVYSLSRKVLSVLAELSFSISGPGNLERLRRFTKKSAYPLHIHKFIYTPHVYHPSSTPGLASAAWVEWLSVNPLSQLNFIPISMFEPFLFT